MDRNLKLPAGKASLILGSRLQAALISQVGKPVEQPRQMPELAVDERRERAAEEPVPDAGARAAARRRAVWFRMMPSDWAVTLRMSDFSLRCSATHVLTSGTRSIGT